MNITGRELRQKYLDFFKNYPGFEHQVLDSAPLIPTEEEQLDGKEKVLFTTAGMQPLIPYLTGKKNPPSKRLVDCQKCLRTDDIEEVGDNTHHTFFEMLGNWSIGDYWKKEAIEMSYKFLVEELGVEKGKLFVTVFEGDDDAPRDEESAEAWKSMGIPENRISYLGKEDNWWPTSRREVDGTLKNAFGPCGPDTEIFYWTGDGEIEGRPETDDRWVEIWNNVFMQYNRKEDGVLEDLPTKNVDTGMGLERTLAILTGKKSAYETDLFEPILSKIISNSESFNLRDARIIADHMKAAVFLINEGEKPSNKERGYVVRRLLRRAATKAFLMNEEKSDSEFFNSLVKAVVEVYPMYFKELHIKSIESDVSKEILAFRATLARGLKKLNELINSKENLGLAVFNLFQSYGFPLELVLELLKEKGVSFTDSDLKQFDEAKRAHSDLSKIASAGVFRGGLAGHSYVEVKYHTATHLLHQALRDVLGQIVFQKGSNITPERLRFDFSFDRKVTEEELQRVEDIVNQKIKADLKVERTYMTYDEAMGLNAIGLFGDKYDKSNVSIYSMGPNDPMDPESKDQRPRGGYYSLEFCGGPHVEHTGLVGGIKLVKEEAVSAGVRRIRAELI